MALFASRASKACVFWSRLLPRSSIVSQRSQERNVAIRSEQFPEYSLILDFQKIRATSRFNKLKKTVTVATAVGIPILFGVAQFGYIVPGTFYTATFIGYALTTFLHAVGVLFNYTIGYIYLKNDGETVKISYVGYWGDRVDIDTTIDKIEPFDDMLTYRWSNPYYRRVRLAGSKKTYKLYLSNSQILDNKIFAEIFGRVY